VVLVAGPWYALVALRTAGRWPTEFLGVHNVSRFLHPMDGHRGSAFYYLLAIAIGFFPWSVFLAPTVLELRRRIQRQDSLSPGAILLACWVGVWLVFFSLSSTKLPNYVVPTFPALALATACFVERLRTQPASVARIWQRLAWGTVALVGLSAIIAIPIVVAALFDGDPRMALIGTPLFIGGCLGWIYVELGETRRALNTMLVSAIALALCVFGYGAVRVDQYQNSPMFASVIAANTVPGETHIGAYRYFRPSLVFYTHHQIVRLDEGAPLVREFFEKNPHNAFLIACEDRWDELQSALPPDVTILVSSRGFLRKQEIMLLGRATANPPPVASGPGATLK
jgi:4-amino-4-deoxy-L-arabinose transferase-like glycosyltransferase